MTFFRIEMTIFRIEMTILKFRIEMTIAFNQSLIPE